MTPDIQVSFQPGSDSDTHVLPQTIGPKKDVDQIKKSMLRETSGVGNVHRLLNATMGFSRQEYRSRLPFPSPDPDPGKD